MRPLSSLGVGLSLVFGCLLLALVAEVYYLLWWKKRIAHGDVETGHTNPARELLCLFCWKKPSSLSSTALNPQEICSSVRITSDSNDGLLHLQSDSSKDLPVKPFDGEDGIETELMRLHNLSGPPRFLFTINEETKEDLESDDGKSKGGRSRKGSRGRSLSDLLVSVETPFLTPLSSPPFLTPHVNPVNCYSQNGFNPLFESSKSDELRRMRSSPPPVFKFLKDAEEKLYRKTLMEEALRAHRNVGSVENVTKPPAPAPPSPVATVSPLKDLEDEEGSFITLIVGKNREKGQQQQQHHLGASQVTPLPSSPSSLRPLHAKFITHLSSKE